VHIALSSLDDEAKARVLAWIEDYYANEDNF
jgi:hypothetical protein